MNVRAGQHYERIHPKGVGRSTFSVLRVEGQYAIIQDSQVHKIKLTTFEDHRRQYRLLKDA